MNIYPNNRALFDAWNQKHIEKSAKIKELKAKREDPKTTEDEQNQIRYDLAELLAETLIIYEFLADVGPMVYIEEEKDKFLKDRR